MDLIKLQYEICEKYGSPYFQTPLILKVGVSISLKESIYPVNGLRHPPEGDTTGWYLWAGEYSDDPDFFVPLHAQHLEEWRPEILKYLALAPGWRFLLTPDYEDVWEDADLLDI